MNQFQATENKLETGIDLSQMLRQNRLGLVWVFLLTA